MQTATQTRPPQQPSNHDVQKMLPIVRRVVKQVQDHVPSGVDREALMGAGMVGLLQAFHGYDPERGVPFETYARIRVRGALQDELRSLDHLTRHQRRRAKSVSECRTQLEREGRQIDDDAIAKLANVSVDEVRESARYSSAPQSVDPMELGLQATATPWQEAVDQESFLIKRQRLDMLEKALGKLPEREQQIMSMYYEDGLTLLEIGEIMGVTQSRVSQIIKQVRGRLKKRLAAA